jgi:hypothetical protein
MAKKTVQVDFHYIKTNNYKTHYANGIFGGITPRGELQMDFFVERQVIPQIDTYEVTGSQIGKLIKTSGKKGIVREIEVGIVMNIETAISFQKWLNERIEVFQKATSGESVSEENNE